MSNIGPFNPSGSSKGGSDDTKKVDKEKFKQKMRQVEAVDKADPDQKAKKRKPTKDEEEQLKASSEPVESIDQTGNAASLLTPNIPHLTPQPLQGTDSSSSSHLSTSYIPSGSPPKKGLGSSSMPQPPVTPPSSPLGSGYEDDQSPPSFPSPVSPSTPSYSNSSAPTPDDSSDFFGDAFDTDYPTDDNSLNTSPSQSSQNPEPSRSEKKTKTPSTPEKKDTQDIARTTPTFSQKQEVAKKNTSPILPPHEGPKSAKLGKSLEAKYTVDSHLETPKKRFPPKSDHEIYKSKDSQHEAPLEIQSPFESKPLQAHTDHLDDKLAPIHEKPSKSKTLKIEEPTEPAQQVSQTLPPMSLAPQAPPPPASASYLSPEVHQLFQTMVGLVMIKQLTHEGMQGTQTEISLDNPAYEKSQFFGLKIVITEYKTAPGSFNIELMGNGSQNKILSDEKAKLISALNDNRYNLPFTVNRLDVSLKKEESDFLFKRKESVKGDNKDTRDQQNR